MAKSKRISITVSEEELIKWDLVKNQSSLSAFIREAVNQYIKVQDPSRSTTFLIYFLNKRKILNK